MEFNVLYTLLQKFLKVTLYFPPTHSVSDKTSYEAYINDSLV